jgi:catechol 2,3-dioxygenase-like lactoylglutathione lyase family enzyme
MRRLSIGASLGCNANLIYSQETQMFSHIMVGVKDLEASRKFYDAVLGTIGVPPGAANRNRYFYRTPTGTFGITTPINGEPASHANGGTIGFTVASAEQGDAFHAAGIANGGTTCEDPPGFRESPAGKMYLAYLRDPDNNKICAVHRPAK